jgi:hypothetical protein
VACAPSSTAPTRASRPPVVDTKIPRR